MVVAVQIAPVSLFRTDTVTPGSTAPRPSVTVPLSVAWTNGLDGSVMGRSDRCVIRTSHSRTFSASSFVINFAVPVANAAGFAAGTYALFVYATDTNCFLTSKTRSRSSDAPWTN